VWTEPPPGGMCVDAERQELFGSLAYFDPLRLAHRFLPKSRIRFRARLRRHVGPHSLPAGAGRVFAALGADLREVGACFSWDGGRGLRGRDLRPQMNVAEGLACGALDLRAFELPRRVAPWVQIVAVKTRGCVAVELDLELHLVARHGFAAHSARHFASRSPEGAVRLSRWECAAPDGVASLLPEEEFIRHLPECSPDYTPPRPFPYLVSGKLSAGLLCRAGPHNSFVSKSSTFWDWTERRAA
jgi:hypothetical protein